jgi:hypothetical protein
MLNPRDFCGRRTHGRRNRIGISQARIKPIRVRGAGLSAHPGLNIPQATLVQSYTLIGRD